MSARTAAERVEELVVEQEMKSKQLRAQRLETQEQAGRVEVSQFSALGVLAYERIVLVIGCDRIQLNFNCLTFNQLHVCFATTG